MPGAMDVPKLYKFMRFGAVDVPEPHELSWSGAMDVPNPSKNNNNHGTKLRTSSEDAAAET